MGFLEHIFCIVVVDKIDETQWERVLIGFFEEPVYIGKEVLSCLIIQTKNTVSVEGDQLTSRSKLPKIIEV